MTLRVLDLFSGIGGFSLGLERTGGFKTVAFCEIEPFCQRVLAKHWPGMPIYDDVRELTGARLAADGIAVDVICGGFPCQDISVAGKRAGLEGARSGLWSEYRRLIGELQPRFAIVENVPGLLSLGVGAVLGDLATLGYDATWDCIPACAVGAKHRRDRLWLVAYSGRECRSVGGRPADMDGTPRAGQANGEERQWHGHAADDRGAVVANADCSRLPASGEIQDRANGEQGRGVSPPGGWWGIEPDVGRVAHGVPSRVDRLRSLGNAVVPQIPELIGKAILEAEGAR